MRTLDQHLTELVKSGQVLYEDALAKSQEPVGFEAGCSQYKGRDRATRPAAPEPVPEGAMASWAGRSS
jgi:hypothetical protein